MNAQLLTSQLQRDIEALKTGPEATRLAFELADEVAISDIEIYAKEVGQRENVGWWYDTTKVHRDDRACVDKAMLYLGLRGRLLLDEATPHIVSIVRP